jgi:hypothetical protein
MSYASYTAGQAGCYSGEPYAACGTTRGNSAVTSQANAAPVVDIARDEAETLCSNSSYLKDSSGNALSGGHLLSVALWKKLADDIAGQSINWSGNAVGSGNMSRGCAKGAGYAYVNGCSSGGAAKSLADNANAGTTAGNPQTTTDQYYDKRVWQLSNGSVVHDFAGNLWEWFYELHNSSCASGVEFTSGTFSYNGISLQPSSSWDSTKGVGRICTSSATVPTTAVSAGVFGGIWNYGASGGVYTTEWGVHAPSSNRAGWIGFRCVVPAAQ